MKTHKKRNHKKPENLQTPKKALWTIRFMRKAIAHMQHSNPFFLTHASLQRHDLQKTSSGAQDLLKCISLSDSKTATYSTTNSKGSTLRYSILEGQAGTRWMSNSITMYILSVVMYCTVPTRPPTFDRQHRCSTRSPTFVLRKLRKLGKLRTQTIIIKKTKNIENWEHTP